MPGVIGRWRSLFRPTIIQYSFGPDAPTQVLNYTALQLYNTQDNLSAVVNFLANSVAQLPLKVYKRTDDNKRTRDRKSAAALLLWRPNCDQTGFEFIRALFTEYSVFGCVYVWVIPDAESESGWQARIIPTEWIASTNKSNSYAPESITVVANGTNQIEIPKGEFVRFATYSPGNPGGYVSPISALRQTLEEQIQAGRFRRELWKSSGRLNAQIIRPKDVEKWSDETRKKWIAAFREAWGPGGNKAGSIPLMEDGMEIKPFSTSFKEQQWAESIKLSREAVAAAYRINPSLIWHSDTQTYASSKDNARALYAECLGPDLQMIQQRINSFLLPMIGADPDTYVEFDLTEKLKGSFEERAAIIQASVGGPWLTRNEARADNNLPPIEGGDTLIVPLNVAEGGQVSTEETQKNGVLPSVKVYAESNMNDLRSVQVADSVRDILANQALKDKAKHIDVAPSEEETDELKDKLTMFFRHQRKSIIPKLGAKAKTWWDSVRWDAELADDLEPILREIAADHGKMMAEALESEFSAEAIVNYIRKLAEARAKIINDETLKKIQEAIEQAMDSDSEMTPQDAAGHVYDIREDAESILLGSMLAKRMAGWGTLEAVGQAERQGIKHKVSKMWVTGPKSRDSHAAMNGETVPIDDKFSNGAEWPGDDSLSPDESCGCNCTTKVIIE